MCKLYNGRHDGNYLINLDRPMSETVIRVKVYIRVGIVAGQGFGHFQGHVRPQHGIMLRASQWPFSSGG